MVSTKMQKTIVVEIEMRKGASEVQARYEVEQEVLRPMTSRTQRALATWFGSARHGRFPS